MRCLRLVLCLVFLQAATALGDDEERSGPLRVHLVRGMFSDFYLLDLALPRLAGAEVTSSGLAGWSPSKGYPGSAAQLKNYDLVIFAGTGRLFRTHTNKQNKTKWSHVDHLESWVRQGGSLFILGDPANYGQSGLKWMGLGEILPVNIGGRFDLKRDPQHLEPGPGMAGHAVLQGIDFSRPMASVYRHHVEAKEDAAVLLGSREKPLLAVSQVGKGKVACLLTPPMGMDREAGAGETLYWNDPRLPRLFENLCRFLITRQPTTAAAPGGPTKAAAKVLEEHELWAIEGDLDELDDEGDLGGAGDAGGGQAPTLSPQELALLRREGGRPALPLLLNAITQQDEKEGVREIEWAARPYVGPENADLLLKMARHIHADFRLCAISLLGKTGSDRAVGLVRQALNNDSPLFVRAGCRAAGEGRMQGLAPLLTVRQKQRLVEIQRGKTPPINDRYSGYHFNGLKPDDPAWAAAEATMALLAMDQPGHVAGALDLLLLLHVENIKLREFLFHYDGKVIIEKEAMARHKERNKYVAPDLVRLIRRMIDCLSDLPPARHAEFRQALLAVRDFEKLVHPLYAAYILMDKNKNDPRWREFRPELEKRAFEAAVASKRI